MPRHKKLPAIIFNSWFKVSPAKTWKVLTTARHLNRWFTIAKKLELKKGGRWDFVGFPGRTLEVKRGKKIAFTHRFKVGESISRITFELSPAGKFTKLQVMHDRFGTSRFTYYCWEDAWPFILCNLKTYLETGAPMCETYFKGSDD